MTRASVVVPTRGGRSRLPRLLSSLEQQGHPHMEIVLVVDGDVDGSADVAKGWADLLPLRLVVLPENRGRAAALNAGFAASTGDVLIRCDDDLEPSPTWVGDHVKHHEQSPRLGVIGLYRNVYAAGPYARAYGEPADARFRRDAYATPADRRWRYWAGNVSVTRDTYERVGHYDTRYRAYGWEDVDWGYRLHATGHRVVLAPDLETLHHTPSVSATRRAQRAYLSGAARGTFEAIHGQDAFGVLTAPSGPWGLLVRALALGQTERTILRTSGAVDRVLPLAPRGAGEKMVSACVESASLAGHRRQETATSDV